jgi:hypothetical protein
LEGQAFAFDFLQENKKVTTIKYLKKQKEHLEQLKCYSEHIDLVEVLHIL